MSATNDGGPAFPTPVRASRRVYGEAPFDIESAGGMSLRDYFAGQALASGNHEPRDGHKYFSDVAIECYEMADAMLAARAQGKQGGAS